MSLSSYYKVKCNTFPFIKIEPRRCPCSYFTFIIEDRNYE